MWTTPLQVASLIGPCEMQGKEWIEPLAEPDRDLAAAMTAHNADHEVDSGSGCRRGPPADRMRRRWRGDELYRDSVSDRRAPEVTVTVRDEAGESVADIGNDAAGGRVPIRGTYAFLQTLDGETWSTAYTLGNGADGRFVVGST